MHCQNGLNRIKIYRRKKRCSIADYFGGCIFKGRTRITLPRTDFSQSFDVSFTMHCLECVEIESKYHRLQKRCSIADYLGGCIFKEESRITFLHRTDFSQSFWSSQQCRSRIVQYNQIYLCKKDGSLQIILGGHFQEESK